MNALVTTNMWLLSYQSTIYQALYYGSDQPAVDLRAPSDQATKITEMS